MDELSDRQPVPKSQTQFTPLQLLNKMINLYKRCWLLISTKTRAFNEKYKLSYPGLNSSLMNLKNLIVI